MSSTIFGCFVNLGPFFYDPHVGGKKTRSPCQRREKEGGVFSSHPNLVHPSLVGLPLLSFICTIGEAGSRCGRGRTPFVPPWGGGLGPFFSFAFSSLAFPSGSRGGRGRAPLVPPWGGDFGPFFSFTFSVLSFPFLFSGLCGLPLTGQTGVKLASFVQ